MKADTLVEAEALVDTLPDRLSEVVAKTLADTLTCVHYFMLWLTP